MQSGPIYSFGGFQLDEGARRLALGNEPVTLPDRHVDILLLLVSRPGQIVSKDELIEAGWKDVAVGDNSLEQAISSLRRKLGTAPDGSQYIETVARRGYRFGAPVTRSTPRQSDAELEALLAPYRMFVEGRLAIETLTTDALEQARGAFSSAVTASPDYAPARVGLANALAFAFDATRADDPPDVASLISAVEHAREACRLDPGYGETWATLAFVLSRTGAATEAIAAGRRAIALEPDNWRHFLRLAYASWGEERLRAAAHAARLLPDLALAHWLAATVHVARQSFDEAKREISSGAAAQDAQEAGSRFGAVGLHLLNGLVSLACGDAHTAEAELARELSFEPAGHIYTRQACANAWIARGAVRLGEGQPTEALAAFDEALVRVPAHPMALAALSVVGGDDRRAAARRQLDERVAHLRGLGAVVEAAQAAAVVAALENRHIEAAALLQAALASAPAGTSAGWTIPVEPLLGVTARPDVWAPVLSTLRARAA
ncbi:MAG TPA: winged helix-turn-helix domain-containing protein [Vicinamibacterales bacterium]|nr:winged helix-turn-helix domain-containing protein [Vicinamibacterales bacterium]